MATQLTQAEVVGEHLQTAADALCHARANYAHVLADRVLHEPEYRSWDQATEVAKITATDFVDGILSRMRTAITGHQASAEGSRLDGGADKEFHQTMLDALGDRAEADGEQIYANCLRKSKGVNDERDTRVEGFRDEIAQFNEDLNPADYVSTSAVAAGRAKTWLNSGGHIVAVSPIAKRRLGRAFAAGLFAAGDYLALKSERDLKEKVGRQMAGLGIQAAAQTT